MKPIVIAIDGTSASGKSTNAKLVARALGYAYVDTGAMYRTAATGAAVSHVAAVPKVREWMVKRQRECEQFGNLVMEGRDIGTNVFPETDYKFYLDASLAERTARRTADGINE